MKRNYDHEMQEIILDHKKRGEKPSLLLHACCAPCSSACLERVLDDFEITVYFYNPNITSEEEYRKRVEEEIRFIKEFTKKRNEEKGIVDAYVIHFVDGLYEPEKFYEAARGLEEEPERGGRCTRCYRLRLEESAKEAKKRGFDYFATTLTLSPLKDAERLNTIGEEVGNLYGVNYLPSDFKKKNGYKRSIELSNEYHLYRQNYCGCVFSKREPDLEADLDHNDLEEL